MFCLTPLTPSAASSGDFRPERADFAVRFNDEITSLRTMGVYVLPNEILSIEALDSADRVDYSLEAPSGRIIDSNLNSWSWKAPQEAGLYSLKVDRPSWTCGSTSGSITLNVFVMVPYDGMDSESLRGYRIGCYPDSPPENLPECSKPRGFVEVTKDNQDTGLSPHFTLGQFLCKQDGDYPKYVVLRERLLMKLECALEIVNAEGHRCDTFHIMSGYRTPRYNRALGNVKYSQHLWGTAADIFIDESPKDGNMDDLNKDGKVDLLDAAVLYDILESMCSDPSNEFLAGGLARYRTTSSHGPFIHIDVRGYRARWGS